MKRLLLIAAMSALVLARPETYKETEDFQYSRSSSDDGTKSGYYGAQRGNMGGNYERAHNMDNLAQHQMSGLVRQVDGELGEGAKTRTGSVYTAANSRGIYGSGNYDLSNLQGRNFAEGQSFGNSQTHTSSSHNSRYGAQAYTGMENTAGTSTSSQSQDARYRGYQTSRRTDQRQIDNLQAVDTSQGLGRYENNNQAGYDMKYHTQYGSRAQSEFDQSTNLHSGYNANSQAYNGYDANSQARYITTPVRVVVRPGGRVAIPIAVPTYSVSQNVLPNDNAANTDAEILSPQGGSTPTNKVKHYEASYSYRKQWEKHHSIPGDISVVVSTESPFPKNSELYEDLHQSSGNQLQNANTQRLFSGNMNSDHRAYTKSGSSRSNFQTGYNTQSGFDSQQGHSGLSSQQSHSDLTSQLGHSGTSSILNAQQSQSGLSSQHRQLDFNAQQSHLGFNSQQNSAISDAQANAYGHNAQLSGMAAELAKAAGDVNSKPKSYQSSYSYHKSWERQGDPYVIKPVGGVYDGQASEKLTAASSNSAAYTSSRQYGSHSRQAHQSYSADCDDQGHLRVARSYNTDQELQQDQWEDLGQQTQNQFQNLEDFGQQQRNKWDNLQDLGQQTQNQWDNLQQLGQETQNQWDNLQQLGQQQQNKWDNLEDLSQHTQRDLEQHQNEKLEDFGQQSQKEDMLTNFEQQSSNQNEYSDIFNQNGQSDTLTNFEQQSSNQNEYPDIFNQRSESDSLTNFEQQSSNQNEYSDIFNQHSQSGSLPNFEQQSSNKNEYSDIFSLHSQSDSLTNFEQQSSNQNEYSDIFNQHSQSGSLPNFEQQFSNQNEYPDIFSQHSQSDSLTNFEQQSSNQNEYSDIINQHSQSGSLPNFEQQSSHQNENLDIFTHHKNEHNLWHVNGFHNFENQFDNSFHQNSFSTSDTGNPLQNFWDKIDNIVGTNMPVKTKDQDLNQMENGYGWKFPPMNPNIDLVNTHNNKEITEEQSGHNNLFEEQTTSTTVLPILLSSTPRPIQNASVTITTQEKHPSETNKNIPSSDVGRGDIESEEIPTEIMTNVKPHKTPEEIETLRLTKEAQMPKEGDIIIQPSSIVHENMDKNSQYKPSTVQSKTTTTTPIVEISTPVTSNTNVHTHPISNYPSVDELDLKSDPLPGKQTQLPHEQIGENTEKPESQDQKNLEQQFEDFTHQGFELTSDNLQQGQKNLEQQFESFNPQENIQGQNLLRDLGQQSTYSFSQEGPKLPSDNLQQGQQNLEQQFEGFSQQENIQGENPPHEEDFGQQSIYGFSQQASELPSDYVQHIQQNLEQQFEDFNQEENIQGQNPLHDFGQQSTYGSSQHSHQNSEQYMQTYLHSPKTELDKQVEQDNPNQDQDTLEIQSVSHQQKPYPDTSINSANSPQIIQPKQVSQNMNANSKNQNLRDTQKFEEPKTEDYTALVETIAEKPGFWKSVGKTFSSAKDKVISWFSSS